MNTKMIVNVTVTLSAKVKMTYVKGKIHIMVKIQMKMWSEANVDEHEVVVRVVHQN